LEVVDKAMAAWKAAALRQAKEDEKEGLAAF
jgi:hypothetical protein